MKYKCIIFDLDGTLLDSLQGILDAVNLSFKELGYKIERKYEEGKYFIGAGAIEFAHRAMAGQNIPVEKEPKIMERFLVNYDRLQAIETKPFKGVAETLKSLEKRGYFLVIASNKPQILLDPIVKKLFPDIDFKIALGQKPNTPAKPDPYIIFEVMKTLKVEPGQCVYVGDSEYDYMTARNAGIDCIICEYGYGFYGKPWFNKVKKSIKTIEELENLV